MNREQLEEIRKRAEAASPGPWEMYDANEGMNPPRPCWSVANDSYHYPLGEEDPPAVDITVSYGWREDAEFIAAARTDVPALLDEIDRLNRERVVSVVFGHHKGAPRPFALYRRSDVTGVSGTGIVAEGAAFSDGTAVLRWLSEWPTSVVFHDRGVEAIEQIHGHGGATQIVWLSDELESLAVMEQERDALRAELEQLRATTAEGTGEAGQSKGVVS